VCSHVTTVLLTSMSTSSLQKIWKQAKKVQVFEAKDVEGMDDI
jgi:hypothetical protein